jgi:cytochrome b561
MPDHVRYNRIAILVHWLTALTIIGLLIVGNIMADMPRTDPMRLTLYNLHKSFGLTVFFLTVFRLVWRATHKPPALPATMVDWEKKAARIAHWALYGLLFLVPILGWVMVSASPRNVPTMVFGTFIWPHIPMLADMDVEAKKAYKDLLENAHAVGAYTLLALFVAHAGAALRHHFVLKDDVMRRMMPALLLAALALPAGAADWQVDPAKSNLGFLGTISGKGFEGHFKTWTADIAFDPANPAAGHAKVVIDMSSAVTGDKQRDYALPDTDWFDARKSPQAFFEATSFTAKGGNAYEAVGTLTIRGTKKPVTMPFTLDIAGDAAHAKGQLDIVRTDYGVGQGEWGDGATIALKVGIVFDLTAKKK